MKKEKLPFTSLKSYLPEFVYGSIDGSVTTFAVVAGASGASLGTGIIIILGFANLIADGFSMSVGNYLSTKSELQAYEKHKRREYWEIKHKREEELEEIRTIYRAKGFEGDLLEEVVKVITSNEDRWVDTMMKEELEMLPSHKPPLHTALVTFVAFFLVGLIPLLTYVLDLFVEVAPEILFPLACFLTTIAFVLIGFFKGQINQASRWRSILETLLLGGLAASLAYFVGDVLEKMLG